jgi:hypothetical protein
MPMITATGVSMTTVEGRTLIGPAGISGWLILPAIGITLAPVVILAGLKDVIPAFDFVEPGSSAHYLLVFEAVLIVVMAVFAIYTAYEFFTRKAAAPSIFITFLVVQMVVVVVVAVLLFSILDIPIMSDPASLLRPFVASAIWIPYFQVSVRVKNTFVN